MIRSGALDRRIDILVVSTDPDASGQPIETITTLATVWAMFMQQSAREFLRDGTTNTETSAVFRTRYHAGITTDHRILDWLSRTWDITEVREIGRRKGLDLFVVART